MSVELRPLGVKCNITCQYCYQNPQRDAGNIAREFDVDAMKAAIVAEGGPFTIFGGEPLMVPEAVLEDLWSWGLQKFGSNGTQSNGSLINDNHVRMFKQYKVHVGISIDGPGELNDVRWAGSLERTREATAKTERAIERLCREGIPPSLIVTLHRCNATADKLPRMMDWFRHLESIGVTSARLHLLEVEAAEIREKYALSPEENLAAFRAFASFERTLKHLQFDLFRDMENLLLGKDEQATCVWRACDPYTTSAVRGVEGFGQRSNCGRTNKEGIDFAKAETAGYERYIALYHTPQDVGGCKGCRFFLMCKGQCPGTSVAAEWRNRTEHCDFLKGLYSTMEGRMLDEGVSPLSSQPAQRRAVEVAMLDAWGQRGNPSIASLLRTQPAAGASVATATAGHGDHTDGHGDHTDGHGDHTDGHSDRPGHGDHVDHGDRAPKGIQS